MKTFIIIPARNEGGRINQVLLDVHTHLPNARVIVVDDGSNDNTSNEAENFDGVVVLRHRINLGKGAALKTGCDAAAHMGAELVALMDVDGQHTGSDVRKVVDTLEKSPVDMIFGARSLNRKMPLMMRAGNTILSWLISLFFGISVSDTQCGLRGFRMNVYQSLRWQSPGYAAETEMLVAAARHHLTFREVMIETVYHDSYKGTTVMDGLRILINIVFWRLQ
ncbi:MAG: glycosyltransferase family 2 protein [Parcubacteria group bacterium]